MSGDDSNQRGFTIVDRRSEEDAMEPAAAEAAVGEAPAGPAPPVDFTAFLLSLATSALYHLGLVADPESGKPGELNLPVARQTIDTLELLEEKTRGNLTDEEQTLLGNLLAELRMRYVEVSPS